MYKEETICKFQQGKDKLHLLKLTNTLIVPDMDYTDTIIHYQVRLNRKRIKTSKFEYEMRKLFAVIAQNIVLQLTIFDNTTPKQNSYEQVKKNSRLVILDHSKIYGWNVKYNINEEEAKNLIEEEQLIEDKESYIPTWFTKERWESTIKPMKEKHKDFASVRDTGESIQGTNLQGKLQ